MYYITMSCRPVVLSSCHPVVGPVALLSCCFVVQTTPHAVFVPSTTWPLAIVSFQCRTYSRLFAKITLTFPLEINIPSLENKRHLQHNTSLEYRHDEMLQTDARKQYSLRPRSQQDNQERHRDALHRNALERGNKPWSSSKWGSNCDQSSTVSASSHGRRSRCVSHNATESKAIEVIGDKAAAEIVRRRGLIQRSVPQIQRRSIEDGASKEAKDQRVRARKGVANRRRESKKRKRRTRSALTLETDQAALAEPKEPFSEQNQAGGELPLDSGEPTPYWTWNVEKGWFQHYDKRLDRTIIFPTTFD